MKVRYQIGVLKNNNKNKNKTIQIKVQKMINKQNKQMEYNQKV